MRIHNTCILTVNTRRRKQKMQRRKALSGSNSPNLNFKQRAYSTVSHFSWIQPDFNDYDMKLA
jgi:hypothetical protein